jgi:hypothetical protein
MMKVTVRIGFFSVEDNMGMALKKDVELSCLPVVGSWVLVDAGETNLSFKVGFVDVYVDENRAFAGCEGMSCDSDADVKEYLAMLRAKGWM